MNKVELLCRHFAQCYRRLTEQSPDRREAAERLATTAADPSASKATRAAAISSLVDLLFPDSTETGAFVKRVTECLRAKDMTQHDLAKALGVTEPAISQILSGKHRPRRRTVGRIAKALDVKPQELLRA